MAWRKFVGLVVLFLALCQLATALAQSSSTSYKVEETYFGSGGELDAQSSNYRSKQAAGELGVGNTASTSYQAQAGFNTTDTPLLEVLVNGGVYDFDVLDSSLVKTLSTSFSVRNYLASGYIAQIVGTAPKGAGGGHTLTNMSSAAASSPGTEQFGINLVANTSPSVGANPSQVPDTSFGFGQAAAGYNTANQFKYNDGDTIAFSNSSSGTTLYTISAIANITTNTQAGFYGTSLFVVVVPTF